MRRLCMAAACLVLPLSNARPQAERVGTFDRRSIVIAFYRSPQWAVTMRRQVAARDSAKQAGDTARVRELEQWGAGHQELAHQQLHSDAPLTNILDALRPAFDSIEKAMNLRAIVAGPGAKGRVESVDVTLLLLDWLKADDKTREIVRQMPPPRTRG